MCRGMSQMWHTLFINEEMITSGIASDKEAQKNSLAWIREQSLDENCIESLANHDPNITPHIIQL